MDQNNICPNCHQPVEPGAKFCGNCDQPLVVVGTPKVKQTDNQSIPEYARYFPKTRQHWASIALVLGLVGIMGSFIIPIFGIIFGIVGFFLAILTPKEIAKKLKIGAIILTILSVIVAIVNVSLNLKNGSHNSASYSSSIYLVTPCYNLNLSSKFTITNPKNSCNVKFYVGSNINNALDIYQIETQNVANLNSANFDLNLKSAIENDLTSHLSTGFSIVSSEQTTFDGQLAYMVETYNRAKNLSVSEEAVLYQKGIQGNNLFIITHSAVGKMALGNALAKSWSWN
jgi:hypothetical protein